MSDHPALAWRRAGLMEVTGHRAGDPLVFPADLTGAADRMIDALRLMAPDRCCLPQSGAALLGERARLLCLERNGRQSANGSCHLFRAKGGWIAVNLARPDDMDMMPAWLQQEAGSQEQIAAAIAVQDPCKLEARGREMGLPVACPGTPADMPADRLPPTRYGNKDEARRPPLVVDLSTLWAGPLAGSLLAMMGADVVKVESQGRPDAARSGNAAFFDLLNAAKKSISLDFSTISGRDALLKLIEAADIVIESARPRALEQLGIFAEQILQKHPGKVWLAISAYGRQGAAANWVGFGDDAAMAAGSGWAMHSAWQEMLFAGDAIADPLAGLSGACAAWQSWRQGGGELLSVSLAGTIATILRDDEPAGDRTRAEQWQALAIADTEPLYPLRDAPCRAAPVGQDTHAVMSALLASAC
ncbi:CoA transferase [Croceicoccus sp. F390]|uniref:CoA transferase n=1 Tax=Croceicoccus esteveae TaxID=3075597 RepID=A0ABU2ZG44_9SPHN|nr:CoA transferase [Croceicoccus sp. F390]MDT0575196.1 CoA transferase [Croceicoccus sp. F390]